MRSISQCLPLAALAFVAACDSATDPTTPSASVMVPRAPNASIADGANGGRVGFYFLPSLVPNPGAFSGTFDATLAPSATICQLNDAGSGCAPVPWLMTFAFGGPEPTGITVDPVTESYGANWNKPTLDVGKYRLDVSVRVPLGERLQLSAELGYVDLQVVSRRKDPVDPGFVGVVKGAPIPFKFRIETRTIAFVVPRRETAGSAFQVGDAVKFTAITVDLHGEQGSCLATWTSSDPAIATVDPDGTVHGVALGSASITAACAGVSGTAPVNVGPPD